MKVTSFGILVGTSFALNIAAELREFKNLFELMSRKSSRLQGSPPSSPSRSRGQRNLRAGGQSPSDALHSVRGSIRIRGGDKPSYAEVDSDSDRKGRSRGGRSQPQSHGGFRKSNRSRSYGNNDDAEGEEEEEDDDEEEEEEEDDEEEERV